MNIPMEKLLKRFESYVKFDTQSDENSETYPSTEKQKELSKHLFQELNELGLSEVEINEYGYVFGTLPANLDHQSKNKIPTIGFIAHVDTSPEVSGANVKPVRHKNYQGGDIVLPADKTQVLKPETDPELKNCLGNDIITSDGTTLLGADNKAGIAEIITAIEYLKNNKDLKYGKIRVAFTVDEEVGQGTKYFDIKKFGAKYAYTIDGETAGEIEDETFCADTVTVTINGVNMHPGYAKNKLVNAVKIASHFISQLPKDSMSPETTEKREGYIHVHVINGGVEKTVIKFLIRDFTEEGLKEKEKYLNDLLNNVMKNYPKATADFQVEESYRNMKYVLDKYPNVVNYAMEAVERSGLKPHKNLIRGGTDGSRLSFQGLPTPNVFTGGHNFHSKREWISLQHMGKAVETIVHIAQVWAEKGDQ